MSLQCRSALGWFLLGLEIGSFLVMEAVFIYMYVLVHVYQYEYNDVRAYASLLGMRLHIQCTVYSVGQHWDMVSY